MSSYPPQPIVFCAHCADLSSPEAPCACGGQEMIRITAEATERLIRRLVATDPSDESEAEYV